MFQHLPRRRSLFGVLCQTFPRKGVEGGTPPGLVLEGGRLVPRLGHQKEGAHGVQVEHGGLQLRQLDGSDANGPNVAEVVVTAFSFHGGDFWGHPVGRSNETLPFAQGGCDLRQLIQFYSISKFVLQNYIQFLLRKKHEGAFHELYVSLRILELIPQNSKLEA